MAAKRSSSMGPTRLARGSARLDAFSNRTRDGLDAKPSRSRDHLESTVRAGMLTVMNRQIRRAQAKQDKKVDREKAKKKEARQDRIRAVRARREERRKASAAGKPVAVAGRAPTEQERKKMPGRFSGALMIATVFVIVLQADVDRKSV